MHAAPDFWGSFPFPHQTVSEAFKKPASNRLFHIQDLLAKWQDPAISGVMSQATTGHRKRAHSGAHSTSTLSNTPSTPIASNSDMFPTPMLHRDISTQS